MSMRLGWADMRRTVILGSLAITLLVAGVVVLVLGTTQSDPMVARLREIRDAELRSSGGAPTLPSVTDVGSDRRGSHAASTMAAPPSSRAPAGPGRAEPRNARSKRAALLAAKLQQLPRATQGPAPAARPAREKLPPEEVAAMEAMGMDWRSLEQVMSGGVPDEGGAAGIEEPPDPGVGHDGE
jgi:hypothetical protein